MHRSIVTTRNSGSQLNPQLFIYVISWSDATYVGLGLLMINSLNEA